jgi:dTDP-4-dehydrorhamnose reductase
MNILVTGANGQLGNEMRIIARESQDKYIFTDVSQIEGVDTTYLDITNIDAIREVVIENKVDVIVNCAAYTNVDVAETNEEKNIAIEINAAKVLNFFILTPFKLLKTSMK